MEDDEEITGTEFSNIVFKQTTIEDKNIKYLIKLFNLYLNNVYNNAMSDPYMNALMSNYSYNKNEKNYNILSYAILIFINTCGMMFQYFKDHTIQEDILKSVFSNIKVDDLKENEEILLSNIKLNNINTHIEKFVKNNFKITKKDGNDIYLMPILKDDKPIFIDSIPLCKNFTFPNGEKCDTQILKTVFVLGFTEDKEGDLKKN